MGLSSGLFGDLFNCDIERFLDRGEDKSAKLIITHRSKLGSNFFISLLDSLDVALVKGHIIKKL